ncbi:GGDEF domain-containing protein [Acanthopleuribacter pedis]|uniref:diguanylate cyclase n=1 Tax=Acanthopleuribacter pedis TaxID=442870 RepID=A0A8J7QHW9_9BACT|nr:GGDEF domain-containing protein [Acanthopleuribacter pedis]MBO1320906.1 GGDEF domain-containing protein [Acanthopleuribacter pedis]
MDFEINEDDSNDLEKEGLAWKQATRLRSIYLGLAAYGVALLVWFFAYRLGFLSLPARVGIAIISLHIFVQIGFILVVRKGWNLRFADASLTMPNIILAITVNAPALFYMTAESRAMMLFLFLFGFYFSILRLTYRQCFAVALYNISLYCFVLWGVYLWRNDQIDLHLEAFNLMVFSASLLWLAFFSGYTSFLRKRLRKKNLENQDLLKKLSDLAERDELTGIANRRKFFARAEELRAWCLRKNMNYAVAIIDLDHFKAVNDNHGHAVGDRVLQTFGRLGETELRFCDVFARIGGEEFAVMVTDTSQETCTVGLERLQHAFSKIHFGTSENSFRVSFSAGVALSDADEPLENLMDRADRALYLAKEKGRKRVEIACDTPGQLSRQL